MEQVVGYIIKHLVTDGYVFSVQRKYCPIFPGTSGFCYQAT